MKAQPKGAAPVSRDVVQEVKRKMGPPSGPPPAGMLSFNAPKNVQSKKTRDDDRRPQYDEYDNHYDDGYDDHNDENRHFDEDEDYYSDEDQHNGGRDFRYDGGHGRHGEQLDDRAFDRDDRDGRDYDRDSRDDRNHDRDQDRAAFDNRSGENAFRTAQLQKARPVENNSTDSLNASAQSKQSGGFSLAHPTAEGKATSAEPVAAHKELTGPATQIVSTYLQRSRVNQLNYQPVLRATYRELKYYVTSPCPPGFTARCYIERNRSGSKMLAPYYSICADLDGNYFAYLFSPFPSIFYFVLGEMI